MIFSKQKIEEVKNRSSLAELASEVTDLKPSGSNLVGLSPFQTEKTPSFFLYDGASRYKCFSSGKSGSVFDFVMETRGMSFPEAVEFLAQRAGISLEGESEKTNSLANKAKAFQAILEAAAIEYKQVLSEDKFAKEYLKQRNVTNEMIQVFNLGYAPDAWSFIQERTIEKIKTSLKMENISELYFQAGLIKKKEEGGFYDAFRARLIFPIKAKDGKYIALGGRILDPNSNAPKYLNSAESLIYEKRSVLYGLYEALDGIRRSKHAYIVEGYFDVISMFQKGFRDTVASCGTAFSSEHAMQLSKLVNKVTAIFDADAAGRKAAARCFESFINTGIETHAILLPQGEDPDSICRNNNISKVEQYFNDYKVSLFDFYVLSTVEELGSKSVEIDQISKVDASIKGETAKKILKTLTKVINPVERESLINKLSELLDVKLSSVKELFNSESNIQQRNSKFYREIKELEVSKEAQDSEEKIGQSLEIYLKQLLVSVLCEPSIISAITESFFNPELLSASLATKIKNMFSELIDRDFAGLSTEDEKTTRKQHHIAVAVLEKYGFTPKNYIIEAYRQLELGGAVPADVAREFSAVNNRLSLKSQLEVIRQQENKTDDIAQLEKLAQEKLLKKRMLKNNNLN